VTNGYFFLEWQFQKFRHWDINLSTDKKLRMQFAGFFLHGAGDEHEIPSRGGGWDLPKQRDNPVFGSASGTMKHYLMHSFL